VSASDCNVPARTVADAEAAFATRAVDSTLLDSLDDSLDHEGPVWPRRIRFAGAGFTMCVVVTASVGHAVLRVEASGVGDVFILERSDATRAPVIGELAVGRGTLRVRVPAGPGRPALHTDWFRL
jgi:hypothetical protein